MTHTEYFLDQILGAFFWLALLVPLGMFGFSMVMGGLKRFWPQTESGQLLHPDQIVTNKIFALGQNAGVRRIDGEMQMRVTAGLRGASLAVLGFTIYWYYDMINQGMFELSYMDFLLVGAIGYYVVFSWTFSVRCEGDRLWVRGWTFTVTEYDLRDLDSMTETQNGSWKLWFADGRKVEVLKFITNSGAFSAEMQERVARNLAK